MFVPYVNIVSNSNEVTNKDKQCVLIWSSVPFKGDVSHTVSSNLIGLTRI